MIRQFALLMLALALPTTAAFADEGDSLWSRTFGGPYDDEATSVIQTSDGGYLLAGWTDSFGAGGHDMWLVKTNAQGDILWSRAFGGPGNDWAYSVIQTSDDGYLLAGGTYSFGAGYDDMWLVKANAQGDSLWSRAFGGPIDDEAHSVIQTSDGGYLLTGFTYFGSGSYDMWLVKTNAQGHSLWSRTFSALYSSDWAYSVIQTSDGGYLLAGRTESFGAGESDMWLVKTNAQGDSLWSRTYGGNSTEIAGSVIQTLEGDYLLAGYTSSYGSGENDMWLVKVDSQGDSIWSRTYGGSDDDYAHSVIPSGSGDFLLAGKTSSFGAGLSDMWLLCVEGPDSNAVEPATSPNHPASFILHPCHPNPFNATTVLSFELPVASLVKVGSIRPQWPPCRGGF